MALSFLYLAFVKIGSAAGSAEFTSIDPNHFQVDPESGAATVGRFPASDHGSVRICDGCGATFTHVLSSYACPGCGGILYPIE